MATSREAETYTDFKKVSQQWLEDTRRIMWSGEKASMAQYLVDRWVGDDVNADRLASTKWATRVLKRWLECEETAGKISSVNESILLKENLHRVLYLWRELETPANKLDPSAKMIQTTTTTTSRQMSLDLYNRFLEASISLGVPQLRPGNKALSLVLSTIARRPDLLDTYKVSLDLVQRFLEQESMDHTSQTTFLHILASCGLHSPQAAEMAEEFLLQMKNPCSKCFSSVIRAWLSVGTPNATERAQVWFERCIHMDLFDNKTATITFNAVLKSWKRLNNPHNAEVFLRSTIDSIDERKSNFQGPNSLSFQIILDAWYKDRSPEASDRASSLLDLIESNRQTGRQQLPDRTPIEIHNAHLKILAREENSGSQVEAMVHRLEAHYEDTTDTLVRPNLLTYTEAINAWASTQSSDAIPRAERIVLRLEQLGAQGANDLLPDRLIYTTLMKVWSNSDAPEACDKILGILRRMQKLANAGRHNAMPSIVTYNTVIHALVKREELDQAEDLLDMLKTDERLPRPDLVSYGTLIHGYRQSSDSTGPKRTIELLEEMQALADAGDPPLEPNQQIYKDVIRAQDKNGNPEVVEALFWKLVDRSRKAWTIPNTDVCNAVLVSWLRSNEVTAPDRAEAIVKWMNNASTEERDCVRPDDRTFRLLGQIWAKSGRSHRRTS